VQVALQIAIPELDGRTIEADRALRGRDDATGKAHTLQDRSKAIAERVDRWASLRHPSPASTKKLAIPRCFKLPARQGQRGHAALLDVFGSITGARGNEAPGYDVQNLPAGFQALMEAVDQ